jgi:hypothetical protein
MHTWMHKSIKVSRCFSVFMGIAFENAHSHNLCIHGYMIYGVGLFTGDKG